MALRRANPGWGPRTILSKLRRELANRDPHRGCLLPFLGGGAPSDLADDYGLSLAKIEAAVRLEVRLLEPERIAA